MKAIEWVHVLADQRARFDKRLFTVTEMAHMADASLSVMHVTLARLVRQGVLCRWAPGRYGLPDGVTPEEVAAAIDTGAYVTGAYALTRHGHVTQVIHEIDCFTRRRHNRSRRRTGPFGTLVFVTANPGVYAAPDDLHMAGPEQALCDLFYVMRRRGLDPRSLYTFRNLEAFSFPDDLLARYPRTVQRDVAALLREQGSPRGNCR